MVYILAAVVPDRIACLHNQCKFTTTDYTGECYAASDRIPIYSDEVWDLMELRPIKNYIFHAGGQKFFISTGIEPKMNSTTLLSKIQGDQRDSINITTDKGVKLTVPYTFPNGLTYPLKGPLYIGL